MIDCSFAGDLSERMLGGSRNVEGDMMHMSTGEHCFMSLYEERKSSSHLFEYLNQGTKSVNNLAKSFQLFGIFGNNNKANIASKFGVPVKDYNENIPYENLYLIPGGGSDPGITTELEGLQNDPEAIKNMAKRLLVCFEDLPGGNWRIFIDTDGETHVGNTLKILLRACDSCVIVTEANAADFRRIKLLLYVSATMTGVFQSLFSATMMLSNLLVSLLLETVCSHCIYFYSLLIPSLVGAESGQGRTRKG